MERKLRCLLICNKPKEAQDANTIVEHIEAFSKYSSFSVDEYSISKALLSIPILDSYDIIILHYSVSLLGKQYLNTAFRTTIQSFKGLKIVFIQDEYRQVNKVIDSLNTLGIDILFSCFPANELDKIYPSTLLPKLAKYTNLTGYVSNSILPPAPKMSERILHIGYRARKLPYWYGQLAYEKWDIVEKWKKHSQTRQLVSDVSYKEESRIYGNNWLDFIRSCKAMLGVESGASVIDFTGKLEAQVELYQWMFPSKNFFEVQEKFLLSHEGKFCLNQISPRCFEAIQNRTVLVLYEGDYSGILKPYLHYIPLRKDFGNINEVVQSLLDDEYLENMATRAYEDIILTGEYSYQCFISRFDKIVSKEFAKRMPLTGKNGPSKRRYKYVFPSISQILFPLYKKFSPSKRLLLRCIMRPVQTLKFFQAHK